MPLCASSIFITGANRGIGLEFVKQLIRLPTPPKHLIATCRNPAQAEELNELAKSNTCIKVLQFDVTNYGAIPSIISETERLLEGTGLNLLINNAGIIQRSTLGEVTAEELRASTETNCIAPLILTQAFLPLLKKAASQSSISSMSCSKAAIINMTSKMGSIADNGSGGRYSYRAAKSALNAVTKSLSIDLAKDGILAAVLHPGWVQTDMGGPNALISSEACVQGLLGVMEGLSDDKTGTFWDYKNEQIPW